ncbi:UDP-glycosyltransferase 87a1 [Phtheirospermum japonicum]|uniref:UDP-glycosyltransferase 87a1 n=1 Tax=Phtheirospermum japonicum TaxID=374723 RepID=A0A830C3L2_9LAMI|nr:UDP-glycosyltransferase 87a1 [Phtheirospermum japonicum]
MAPAESTGPTPSSHVVVVPYPGRGHVNPMMNLCKLLTNSQPNLVITFVITEEWLGFIGSEDKPPSVRFATIPNVLPSELARAADMVSFVGATQTEMAGPFERLLDRLGAPVDFIIADTFLNWAVEVGNRRDIPVASLWPMPASVFSVFYHFDLLVRNGHHPFELSERGDERVDYIPGIASIRLADIPSIAHMKDQRLLNLALRIFANVAKAQSLLFTSIYELEPQVIEALKQEFSFPIYTFGPAIPYFNLKDSLSFLTNHHHQYFEWLNSQPPSSVLYVSLGSFLSVSSAQMDEIADGLRESGVRFLWVARGEATRLQERCGDVGRVVSWCEQLKVLSHPSVGGFWTHCGWNSTMEGIFAGVPIIAFPLMMDQTTIRKHIVEDWQIGIDAKREVRGGDLLRSRKIAELVKKFMDLESIERKEIARRSKEFKEVTLRAISEGGSSKLNLRSLLDDITSSG